VVDTLEEGKKKRSKKLKRIYDRLEVEKQQKKEKKKKSGESFLPSYPNSMSEKQVCSLSNPKSKSKRKLRVEVIGDERSVKENVLCQGGTKKKSKKSKKLKRIYDRIQTEKQKKDVSGQQKYNGRHEYNGNWNPHQQRTKGSSKESTGTIKHGMKEKQSSKKMTRTGFNGIPINASKGFKTKFSDK
jgi:hypothetical protein